MVKLTDAWSVLGATSRACPRYQLLASVGDAGTAGIISNSETPTERGMVGYLPGTAFSPVCTLGWWLASARRATGCHCAPPRMVKTLAAGSRAPSAIDWEVCVVEMSYSFILAPWPSVCYACCEF